MAILPTIATAILTALPQIIDAALNLFMGVVEGLVQVVPVLISAVLDLLPQLVDTLLGMLPTIIDSALELFLGIVTGVLDAIPDIIVAVLGMLPQIIETVIGMIPRLIEAAVQLFTGIVEALPIILPKLIDALIKLAPVMVDTLIGLVPQLIQAGVDLVAGLVKGLWNAAGSVGSALLKIAQDAIGGFLSFLGINSPSKLFASFGKYMGQGLVKGLTGSASDVSKAVKGLVGQTSKLFEGLRSQRDAALKKIQASQTRLERATIDHNTKLDRLEAKYAAAKTDKQRAAIQRQINDEQKKYGRLRYDLRKSIDEQKKIVSQTNGALKKGNQSAINKLIRDANTELSKIAKDRDKIADRLAAARDKLADAVGMREDFRNQIRAGVSGLFDITALDETGQTTAADMVARLQQQVAATKQFRGVIDKLTKLGLDKASIADLTENFARTGSSAAAEALLAGGKESVKQVADLRAELSKQGDALGKSVSTTLYQAGIDAAQGLVDGLKKQDKELKEAADKIADDLVVAIKKKLGIKSPSVVLKGVGVNTVQGLIGGIKSLEGKANEAMRDILHGESLTPARMTTPNVSTTSSTVSKQVIFEEGAIKVDGDGDPAKTAQETADRTAEKVSLGL